MFHKYKKYLSVICTVAVISVMAAPAYATTLPSVGAAPDSLTLNAASTEIAAAAKTETTNTETTNTVATTATTAMPVPITATAESADIMPIALVTTSETADVTLSVGDTAADKSAEIHMESADEAASVDENSVDTTETVSGNDMEYANLVIAKVNDYVNVRSDASEEAEILGKLYDKSVGTFLSEKDGWYEIASGNVRGYVKAEYVVTGMDAVELAKEVGKRIATVTTTTLFVREEPSEESSVIGMVPIEDELTVLEEDVYEGWVKVSVEEGDGYVSTDFVTLDTEFVKAESKAEEEARLAAEEAARKKANAAASKKSGSKGGKVSGGGSGAGSSVANYALQFVGNPYVYGGSSLTNGTDCSGFVMSVYAHFGVGLPHSSGAQRGCGYDVGGIGNAQPGDIVCYSGHVGIYIGGGQIVHASTAKTGIKVSNAGYRQILSVRRIF